MPMIRDIADDIRSAKKIWLPWWGVLCWMAACALITWSLIELGRFDLALPVLNSIAVVGFTVVVKRRMATRVWFWITMAVMAALHVPLVLFVPWTTKWIPAIVFAVVDSLDFCLMLWVLAVVRLFVDGSAEPTAQSQHGRH